MIPELHVIERKCTRTPGSIKRLVLIDPLDLASQPDWHLVPNVPEIEFAPGKGGYEFGMKQLNGRLSDNTNQGSDGGDFFEYSLEARVHTVSIEMEYLRNKLRNRRIHVLVTYYDDTQRLVPNMRINAKGDSDGKTTGFNGYSITGIAQLERPAPYIDGLVIIVIPPTPPSSPISATAEVVVVSRSTNAVSFTESIPSGVLLMAIWIQSNQDQEISIGLTAGSDDLGGPVFIPANTPMNFAQSFRTVAATDVFLSGLEGTNTIEFWYAQIGEGDVVKISINSTEAEYEFVVPSGVLLTAVWIKGDTAEAITIGYTSGADDLGGPQTLAANQGYTFAQTLRTDAPTSIFISGMTGNNQIEIWYCI